MCTLGNLHWQNAQFHLLRCAISTAVASRNRRTQQSVPRAHYFEVGRAHHAKSANYHKLPDQGVNYGGAAHLVIMTRFSHLANRSGTLEYACNFLRLFGSFYGHDA